jgi:hypothetical protein
MNYKILLRLLLSFFVIILCLFYLILPTQTGLGPWSRVSKQPIAKTMTRKIFSPLLEIKLTSDIYQLSSPFW